MEQQYSKLSPNFSFSWADMDFILNFPHPHTHLFCFVTGIHLIKDDEIKTAVKWIKRCGDAPQLAEQIVVSW